MKYEVEVQVLPSNGGFAGKTEKVPVDAPNEAMAMAAAVMQLDARGITNVSVLKTVPTTS